MGSCDYRLIGAALGVFFPLSLLKLKSKFWLTSQICHASQLSVKECQRSFDTLMTKILIIEFITALDINTEINKINHEEYK